MNSFSKMCLGVAIIGALVAVVMLFMGLGASIGIPAVTATTAFALFIMGNPKLKKFAFTAWVFASVAASYYYPPWFGTWFGQDLGGMIVPLIQIIMFGMGTTLNIGDFVRVAKMPIPILIGIVLQYGFKPVVALLTAKMFGFTGPTAAGIVLIGSVPGGVASNLMTYLASGDVALSVTMTSFSTILSPLCTPLAMKTLAGEFIPVEFWSMFFSIINMIIVPVVAGLIANKILYSKENWAKNAAIIVGIGTVSLALALIAIFFGGVFSVLRNGILLGAALLALTCYAKLIVNILMNGPDNWMDKVLPMVSMFGIVFIIAVITSRSTEGLASAGLVLILVSLIQIVSGFVAGFWVSRAFGQSEKVARTVSIEVGLQNGGMASALAMNVLKSAEAALASVVYGPMMNVMGSMVATWWHGRPVKEVKK